MNFTHRNLQEHVRTNRKGFRNRVGKEPVDLIWKGHLDIVV